MRRFAALLTFLLSISALAGNRPFTGTVNGVDLTGKGYASYTAPASASTLATTPEAGVAIHPWAQSAVICNVGTTAIRWSTAVTPTATLGNQLAAGACIVQEDNRYWLDSFRFIRESAGAALFVDYGY